MKTHLRLALLLLGLLIAPLKLWAQGAAFSCDGTFYQVRQSGTGATAFSVLYVVNRNTAAYTTSPYTFGGTNATGTLGVVVNALAYNSQDSYLYALSYPADNGTPNATEGIRLYRIGQGGIQDLGRTDLPLQAYNSGTIDKSGNYLLNTRANGSQYDNTLFRLNLADFATVLTSHSEIPIRNAANQAILSATTYMRDIALNPADNNLYGVGFVNQAFRLVLNPTLTQATITPLGTGNSGDVMGSAFFDVAGNMYAYSNGTTGTAGSGEFYSVNTTNGAMSFISSIDPVSNSDGASCINPDQRIDVVKEVTNVVYTDNGRSGGQRQQTYDVAFAIRVKNTGTATDQQVQVTDFLSETFAGATYSILTAPVVTNFGVNGTQNPTLAVNLGYTGSGTNADLLTGNQALSAGQSALIEFTVRLTYSGGSPTIPTAPFNNSAYASTISGTQANQGHIQVTGVGILPPGNLLAQDESNNSAAFPVTPNADASDATPIYLSPAILGNVFEDANYGGGAGRSQATSSGGGVSQARVELYNASGAFVVAVNTDAAGNYVFTGTGVTANTSYQVRVVNGSVVSNRPGSIAGLLSVQTFINGDVNRVGGENPNLVDFGNITTGNLPAGNTTNVIQSVVTVTTPASGPRVGVDFGFNFSTVVNTNNSGQGSLRQFIINSNTLTNADLDQAPFNGTVASGTTGNDPAAGVETSIFMINDGRATGAPAGLRIAMIAPAGYNVLTGFTITPTSALPTITDNNTALDGNKQANLTGNKIAATAETTTGPEVTINFNNQAGLLVTGGNTLVASVGLNNARGTNNQQGAGLTFSTSSASGSTVTDVTATGNNRAGVRIESSSATALVTNITVTNNVLNGNSGVNPDADGLELLGTSAATVTGNTISNNKGYGIFITSNPNTGNTIANNIIRNNGTTGGNAEDAGISIKQGTNNTFSGNTITGNVGDGIVALSGTSGNVFTKNTFSGNGDLGIDLSAGTADAGDGATKNATGKTATSGANGLLNFPVLRDAVVINGNLEIDGYAPAGSTIEVFLADRTTAAFGQGQIYLFTSVEGGNSAASANGTTSGITDTDTRTGNYSGTVNSSGLDQGSETNAPRFVFSIPLSSLTSTQRTALTTGTPRLTATATISGTTTSEFSANVLIGQNRPLPVELKAFEVTTSKTNALLTWSTASEKDNDHFDVERSLDGRSFERIGQVRGQGTTAQVTNYSFTDANVGSKHPGVVYYRLQQVDADGTASFSPVRTVRFSAQAAGEVQIRVFPNPATVQDRIVTLDLSALPQGSYQATLLDATGRSMGAYQVQGGANKTLDVQALPAGAYIILVRGNGFSLNQRLMKK